MSLRVDMEQMLEELRGTRESLKAVYQHLGDDIKKIEGLIDKHLAGNNKVPAKVLQNLEEIMHGKQE